jgi:hypothetical protein
MDGTELESRSLGVVRHGNFTLSLLLCDRGIASEITVSRSDGNVASFSVDTAQQTILAVHEGDLTATEVVDLRAVVQRMLGGTHGIRLKD